MRVVGREAARQVSRNTSRQVRSLDCILAQQETLKVVQGKYCVIHMAYMDLLYFESDSLFCLKSSLIPKDHIIR